MSVSTCVKCDNETCRELLHFDPMLHPGEWHLPDHWLSLIVGDTQLNSTLHFCSKECLYRWLQSPAERVHVLEAEDKKRDAEKCMLFMILIQDFLRENDRTNGFIHARSRTLQELFALRFPHIPKLTETIEGCIDTQINIWRYALSGANDDHIEWAYVAKKCGLIDDYKVEEVPA